MFKRKRSSKGYWFTIVAANNQVLATSETYTTAAMRDKGIEAVKRAVWKSSSVQEVREWWGEQAWNKSTTVLRAKDIIQVITRRPSDTFHIENKEGKIVKR